MTTKEVFKSILDNRQVEPFLEYARTQGVRLGNLIVKRAFARLAAKTPKPLTLRQQVAARLAEEYLHIQKATTPASAPMPNGHARVEMTFEELNRPSVVQFD